MKGAEMNCPEDFGAPVKVFALTPLSEWRQTFYVSKHLKQIPATRYVIDYIDRIIDTILLGEAGSLVTYVDIYNVIYKFLSTHNVDGTIFAYFCLKCKDIAHIIKGPYKRPSGKWCIVIPEQRGVLDMIWLVFYKRGILNKDLTMLICEYYLRTQRGRKFDCLPYLSTMTNSFRYLEKNVHIDWMRISLWKMFKKNADAVGNLRDVSLYIRECVFDNGDEVAVEEK